MDNLLFTVDVGWTNTRPVRPDEHVTRLQIFEPDESSALITANAWIMGRPSSFVHGPKAEMITSFKIVEVEI